MRDDNTTNGTETEEITVEVDAWTAERLEELAWGFETTADEIAEDCCRYGVRNYEDALELGNFS